MSTNKSIISYFLWIIYTIAAMAGLWAFASLICVKTGYGAGFGLAAGLCVLVAEALACAFFHATTKKHKLYIKKIVLNISEAALAVILLAISVAACVFNMPNGELQNTYYNAAAVKSGNVIRFDGDVIEFLYLKTMHAALFVFGNKISVAVIFQIATAFLSLVLIYFALRKLAGAIPGLTMLAFMAASGAFVSMVFDIEPDIFRFFIFSLGLFVTTACSNSYLSLAVGIYIGFFAGDCAITITLAVIAVGRVVFAKAGRVSGKIYKTVFTVVGIFGGIAAYFMLVASYAGMGYDKAVSEWINNSGLLNINIEQYGWLAFTGYEAVVMQVLICLGIFSFWVSKKSYLSGMWLVQFICMAVLAAAAQDKLYILCAVYMIMSVLAGIALRNLTETAGIHHSDRRSDKDMEKNSEIEYANIENVENTVNTENIEITENMETTESAKDNRSKEGGNMAENRMTGTPGKTVTVNVDGENRQIKLLDNPLTLPKKKEHKTMDYDYEVADDDDFDI